MRRRPTTAEHSEVVSRRLEALRAELHGLQPPAPWTDAGPDPEPTHTRIRGELPGGARPSASPAAAPAGGSTSSAERWVPATVEVPVPGRHASRRPRRGVDAPDWLGGASWRVTAGHVKVVAVLCAVALAGALWALTSGGGAGPGAGQVPASAPVATTPLASTAAAEPGGAVPGTGTSQPAGEVTVDVAGKVRRPQIVVLPVGSRVVDAIKAAGGSRPGVDLTPINLARVLVDGEQIVVGGTQVALPPPGASTATSGALVNINTADQTTLETLPGVGPVTATSIIAWRTDNAGFSSVDELLEVDGIGEATLADLSPLVTV